jgi:hypothetical protein
MFRKVTRWALPMLPLVLGFACLALFDASEQTEAPESTRLGAHRPTRLIVLMIDSLDQRDVQTPGSLPHLHARLAQAGLHGPVRACIDGVTIPCVSAMVSGFDRASGFSPLRNFGAARSLAEQSVLGALQQRGFRVGYFGDPLLAKALRGLTVVHAPEQEGPADDEAVFGRALASLTRDRLDVAFIHLLAIDESAHKFGAEGEAYREALRATDQRIARAFAALGPEDHLVVLGDHGHEPSGRHSADVGMHTYAAYFGPQLRTPRVRPMVMTDHAAIWARLFGLRWDRGCTLASAYFDDARCEVSPDLHTRPRRLLPLSFALVLAISTLYAGKGVRAFVSWRSGITVALGSLIVLAASALVAPAWRVLGSDVGSVTLAILLGVAGALVLSRATPREPSGRRWLTLGVTGALLWALPTAEPSAGIKAPVLWLLAWLSAFLVRGWRARRAHWRANVCFVGLLALALVRVDEHLPRSLFALRAASLVWTLLPATLMVAAVYAAAGRAYALACLAGCATTLALPSESSRWWIVPCALVLPASFLAFARPRWLWACVFVVPIACDAFYPHGSTQLAAVATSWLLWALLPALLRGESTLLRASACALLLWLSFWAAMSTRIGGVDYDFYFRWLPAEAGATGEAVQQGLLTAAKCMLPSVFGALLAQRSDALPRHVIEGVEHLTRVRLAVAIVFTIGLSLARAAPDLPLLYDATQEIAFWLLMFAVLGLIAAANPLRPSAHAAPSTH